MAARQGGAGLKADSTDRVHAQDSFSDGSFQPPEFRRDDWRPPLWARTIVWLVKDVGVPVVALGVISAVLLGWIDSPLMRLRDVDSRSIMLAESLVRHADASVTFQFALLESLRKQRCMTALASTLPATAALAQAALSPDPCVALENIQRR